jgi:hypothetical protein
VHIIPHSLLSDERMRSHPCCTHIPPGQEQVPQVSAFRPRGSLDRRVNYRRVSQPRWVGARRSTEGGREQAKGKPAAFVLSCAQVGCACSRWLQASAWERARDLRVGPFSRAANLLVREHWTFLFYRDKERVQVYNGGCSSVLTCLAERS